MAKHVNAADL